MMNQQQQQPQQPASHQMGGGGGAGGGGGGSNNYHHHGGSSSGGGAGRDQSSRGGIQNRLNHFNNQPDPLPAEPVPHKQTETEQLALDYLTEVVTKLGDNPGMFENFQKRLREMFLELADNHFVMSNAIETIFEQVSFAESK